MVTNSFRYSDSTEGPSLLKTIESSRVDSKITQEIVIRLPRRYSSWDCRSISQYLSTLSELAFPEIGDSPYVKCHRCVAPIIFFSEVLADVLKSLQIPMSTHDHTWNDNFSLLSYRRSSHSTLTFVLYRPRMQQEPWILLRFGGADRMQAE